MKLANREVRPVKHIIEPAKTVASKVSVQAALNELQARGVDSSPVTDQRGELLGAMSKNEMNRKVGGMGHDPKTELVETHMEKNNPYCFEDQTIAEAAQIMLDANVAEAPVVTREKLVVGTTSLEAIAQEIQLEIGHVLFIEIVGYSKLLITEQNELLSYRERALAEFEIALSDVVRETWQFRSAEMQGKLVRLPTGDGMALVFRNSPEAPAQCALGLSKTLKAHPELSVRMGIHSGPVNEVADVNARPNITGAGINVAQRVMDCGDAGHILVSKRVADDLEQYRQWRSHLHDLGECEVKHGVRVHVVNLYTEELGNPNVPEKLRLANEPGGRHVRLRKKASTTSLTFKVGRGSAREERENQIERETIRRSLQPKETRSGNMPKEFLRPR